MQPNYVQGAVQQPYVQGLEQQQPVLLPKPSSPQGYPDSGQQQFAPQQLQQPMMAPQYLQQQPLAPQQYSQQPVAPQYAQPVPTPYASSHALVPMQQPVLVDPAASAALALQQQQLLQSQQQQQAMGAMTNMVMMQTMQQMQQQQQQQQQPQSGGGGAPAGGPLQLDVTVEWVYCGSHTPVEEREWDENKYRILVKADSTAETIAQEALGRATMGEFGVVEHTIKTEEGYEISPTDPVALVSSYGPGCPVASRLSSGNTHSLTHSHTHTAPAHKRPLPL